MQGIPETEDLSERIRALLRFVPGGRVWMDENRVAMIGSAAFANLRRAMFEGLEVQRAQETLHRIGYTEGSDNGRLLQRLQPDTDPASLIDTITDFHSLAGFAESECVRLEFDTDRSHFAAEFIWRDSLEAGSRILTDGIGTEPACWMQTGHYSGFFTTITGIPILFREQSCQATGHAHCHVVGRPISEWDDLTAGQDIHLGRHATMHTPGAGVVELGDVVGASPAFFAAVQLLDRVASTDATVLLLGETGVGKEVFARMLHRCSRRAAEPFVAVNCAAIPDNLMEAELFGVEKGAFTGATESRPGRFERAHGDTLFLDEIGSLNFAAQSKLLRALQEGEIERVGDRQTRRVDTRVVSATHVDLAEAVRAGDFREDLYFRLNVFPIRVPPLRERRDDIPMLMHHFLERFTQRHGRQLLGFTQRAVEALLGYDYPGNVRELEHMIERAVILASDGSAVDLSHFSTFGPQFTARGSGLNAQGRVQALATQPPATTPIDDLLSAGMPLERIEAEVLQRAVALSDGNLAAAARSLGMTRPQLAYRLKRHNGAAGGG